MSSPIPVDSSGEISFRIRSDNQQITEEEQDICTMNTVDSLSSPSPAEVESQNHLTLSQTTNFGLFQTESVCKRQF